MERKDEIGVKRTVLITPVGPECNLFCVYCYHNKVRLKEVKKMPEEILEEVIRSGLELNPVVDFLWHGGEPLLAGLDFFRKAVFFQKKYREEQKIRNIVQTNATLINDEWVDFFAEENFHVGTSLDGPARIHNICRRYPSGRGSFKSVMRGIEKIKARQKIGIITLITEANVNYPEEIYKVLRLATNRSIELHCCSGTEPLISKLIPSEEKIFLFLRKVFDLWLAENNPNFRIRTFVNAIRAFYGGTTLDCASGYNKCRLFVAVDERGDVYSCHRFLKRQEFYLGNILEKPLDRILADSQKVYDNMAKVPEECFDCQWWKYCGGGCAHDRWLKEGKFNSLYPYCSLRKKLFSYIVGRVKEIHPVEKS